MQGHTLDKLGTSVTAGLDHVELLGDEAQKVVLGTLKTLIN